MRSEVSRVDSTTVVVRLCVDALLRINSEGFGAEECNFSFAHLRPDGKRNTHER